MNETKALDAFANILHSQGFIADDEDTMRLDSEATFALAHLARRDNKMMVRLSIGLKRISETGVVVSADLHNLISPDHFFWYDVSDEGLARMERDLVEIGIPWITRMINVKQLIAELERREAGDTRPQGRRRWLQFATGPDTVSPRTNPLRSKALSFCYELQGDYVQALSQWRRYLEGKALAMDDPEITRLRELEGRAS